MLSRKKYNRKSFSANAFWQCRRKDRKGCSVAMATSQNKRSCHQDADCGHALLWLNNSYLFSGNNTGNIWHAASVSPLNHCGNVFTMCHIHHWCGHGGISAFADIEFAHRTSKYRILNFRHHYFFSEASTNFWFLYFDCIYVSLYI